MGLLRCGERLVGGFEMLERIMAWEEILREYPGSGLFCLRFILRYDGLSSWLALFASNTLELSITLSPRAMKRRQSSGTMLHGYTQREVADFLGLHFTSVSRITNQRNKMLRK